MNNENGHKSSNGNGNGNQTIDLNTFRVVPGNGQVSDKKPVSPDPMPESRTQKELSTSRVSRSEAESMRQRVGNDIVEATRDLCQKLVTEAEMAAGNARKLETAAKSMFADAENKRDQAAQTVRDADQYKRDAWSASERDIQEYRDKAVAAAESKCREMMQNAQNEAQRMMTQAEIVRDAVQEELEAQRIYTEAARMMAESNETLAEFREKTTIGVSCIKPVESADAESFEPETTLMIEDFEMSPALEMPEAEPEMIDEPALEAAPVKKTRSKAKAK
ncbi:MAG: hypothetical protein O2913_08435 [Chloroflexi bacterium]|nr:hypothetical protein [Chloroflexota bacterium]